MSNTPKKKRRRLYHWCDETYKTRREVEDAIASSLCNELCNGDAGSVEYGSKTFCLHVRVTLIR